MEEGEGGLDHHGDETTAGMLLVLLLSLLFWLEGKCEHIEFLSSVIDAASVLQHHD